MKNHNYTTYTAKEFKEEFGIDALYAVLDDCNDCNLSDYVENEAVYSHSFKDSACIWHAAYDASICLFKAWLEVDEAELGEFANLDEAAEAWEEYCAAEHEEYLAMLREERELSYWLGR